MAVVSLEQARRQKLRGPSGAPGPKKPPGKPPGRRPGGEPPERTRPTVGQSLRSWGVLLGVALAVLAWDVMTGKLPRGAGGVGEPVRSQGQ